MDAKLRLSPHEVFANPILNKKRKISPLSTDAGMPSVRKTRFGREGVLIKLIVGFDAYIDDTVAHRPCDA